MGVFALVLETWREERPAKLSPHAGRPVQCCFALLRVDVVVGPGICSYTAKKKPLARAATC